MSTAVLFDWLISGYLSVNPSREDISILSGKYKYKIQKIYVCPSCGIKVVSSVIMNNSKQTSFFLRTLNA